MARSPIKAPHEQLPLNSDGSFTNNEEPDLNPLD